MKKIALMFPGQGSQQQNMGIGFLEKNQEYFSYFELCSSLLGVDIIDIIKNKPHLLNQTGYSQPAIFSLSCAIFDYMDKEVCLSEKAGTSIGHSLGDYSALYGCGAFSFDKGLDVVIERARLMAEENKRSQGMMAAVLGIGPEKINQLIQILKLDVYIANYNHHTQTVISGESKYIKEAIRLFKENGIKKIIPLKVGVASHCPLMSKISTKLRDYMYRELDILPFNFPFYSSTENSFITEEEVRKNLEGQLVKPIRWLDSVIRLLEDGFDTFIEVGPNNVLCKLVKTIAGQAGFMISLYNLENAEELFKKIKGGS